MHEPLVPLLLVLVLVLAAEFVNGFHDAPNAIATVVSTRVLTPRQAVAMAAVLNLAGAVATGTAVAATVGKGIVDPKVIDLATVGAAMVAIVIWNLFTWRLGLPSSSTHALVAALTGAGLVAAGPSVLLWSGWEKVLLGLVFSTVIGFSVGILLMVAIYWILRRANPLTTRKTFGRLQIVSSAVMAFSHGSNDGQKFMGIFTLALMLDGAISTFAVPWNVLLLCGATMAAGTMFGGWRILRTMGFKLTRLEPVQGFAAETSASATILVASHFGIPTSTTHTISTSIMGVGASGRFSAVRWGVTRRIVLAWILTFPACAILAALVTLLLKRVF
ncbi:MAG: inorganic phosphate transporter [Dehalococcoidia bacterium]|nr:inorganic phosphate transporter [Dehalococcoidia bacterium]